MKRDYRRDLIAIPVSETLYRRVAALPGIPRLTFEDAIHKAIYRESIRAQP